MANISIMKMVNNERNAKSMKIMANINENERQYEENES
jgi:hypothetical protein